MDSLEQQVSEANQRPAVSAEVSPPSTMVLKLQAAEARNSELLQQIGGMQERVLQVGRRLGSPWARGRGSGRGGVVRNKHRGSAGWLRGG